MGPGPFAGMTLADMGADVVRVERPGGLGVFPGKPTQDNLNRGKRLVSLDLKNPSAVAAVLSMAEHADILIEGHRPGVAERLGIGPDQCHARNPALVYGRMTGWGQDGPLAQRAGHDISYIALTGALHAIGDADGPPQIPLNLVGDFGGGGAYLVMGVLAALWEAGRTGRGRVVDAAIIDGAAHLLSGTYAMINTGTWRDERGVNMPTAAHLSTPSTRPAMAVTWQWAPLNQSSTRSSCSGSNSTMSIPLCNTTGGRGYERENGSRQRSESEPDLNGPKSSRTPTHACRRC